MRDDQETIRRQVEAIVEVWATLDPARGQSAGRRVAFERLRDRFGDDSDPVRQHFARLMRSFQGGLFVGPEEVALPQDNPELERWFRGPKGHERRIHGHRHAGVRIVQGGPTLLPVLDAHLGHPEPLVVEDLLPYRDAQPPRCQQEALHRREVMREARSQKKRGQLLAELERRYLNGS